MNLTDYTQIKEANAVTITPSSTPTNVPNIFDVTSNIYDRNTGELTGTEVTTVTLDGIKQQIAGLQSQLDNLNALLADLPLQVDPIIQPEPVV